MSSPVTFQYKKKNQGQECFNAIKLLDIKRKKKKKPNLRAIYSVVA